MSRIAFALLLAALTGLAITHIDAPHATGQDKKKDKEKKKDKDKDKNKTPEVPVDPKDAEKGEMARVTLAFDPGAHTRPIVGLAFTKDQSKLVTVGWDYSVQVWNTRSGERVDILRLPPYGRDNGADTNRWSVAAVSPDGALVAVGGGPKVFGDINQKTQLVVVDVAARRVRRVVMEPGAVVTAVGFSADGNRLAISTTTSVYLLDGVKKAVGPKVDEKALTPTRVPVALKPGADEVALSGAGDKLVVAQARGRGMIWDVSGTAPAKWKQTGTYTEGGRSDGLAWAPDGSHFARAWGARMNGRGIDLVAPDGKLLKSWQFGDLAPGLEQHSVAVTLRYLAADKLFVSGHGGLGKGDGIGAFGVVIDPNAGKAVRRFSDTGTRGMYAPYGTASETGDLAATTVTRGLEVAIYNLSTGAVVARCGSRTPVPTVVGWATDPAAPALAWTDDPLANPFNTKPADLKYGFDLKAVEPVAKLVPAAFDLRRLKHGDWSVEYTMGAGTFTDVRVKQAGKPAVQIPAARRAVTLVPNGDDPPLVAYATHDDTDRMGAHARLIGADGKLVAAWLPTTTDHRDMVSSPDGRYVVAPTGTHRLTVYRTDGSRFPMLSLVRANGEWVAWTPEGYYAGSPGGDKLIGWAVHNGPNELVTYHAAERYSKHFRRPDVIKLALEKGSVADAVAALSVVAPEVERILPPKAKLEVVEQRGATVKVRASATPGTAGKPVLAMRVLLDGRPLPDGQGLWAADAAKAPEGVYEIAVPPGAHELKVLVRTDEGAGLSEPVLVRGPKAEGKQPTIHRVCVGINQYDDAGLKLGAAANDARSIFDALETKCVGKDNRFGTAKGDLILDKDATSERVLKALADARKAVKPGDLLVVFFAGHGVKQGDTYYLLTREADISKDLKGKSLSGDDLRKALADVECPVLLILDACHSAGAVKSFRPATDDLTRALTDDTVGVTVMSAAMSYEVAGGSAENGHFTSGLLKGLNAGEGVPFDPYERQLYVHHLYSVAFSEVRRASGGKQNPFLNMPWTSPPLPLREVPER